MLADTSLLSSIYPLFANLPGVSLLFENSFMEQQNHHISHHRLKAPTAPCLQTYDDGSSIEISYLPSSNEIQYIANVTATSYFALGYGTSMTNTDMVSWIANGTGSY